jgi:SAM-dependent methyltransferase
MSGVVEHYDAEYFAWQRTLGEFGGWANLPKFQPYIRPDDAVLDFGCGGGFLLNRLDCAERLGVEPNPWAASVARQLGIRVFSSATDVPSESADVVISDHALEHSLRPFDELSALYGVLRPGGRLILVVPSESPSVSYTPNDRNQHLYTWSPMCVGNLVASVGFEVVSSRIDRHSWPPMHRLIATWLGRSGFELSCRMWALIDRRMSQTKVIARKPIG